MLLQYAMFKTLGPDRFFLHFLAQRLSLQAVMRIFVSKVALEAIDEIMPHANSVAELP